MATRETIYSKLEQALEPEHLEVVDESHMHNVPLGSESHFRVVVASGKFDDLRRLARHRLVNTILREELAANVHALAVHAVSPAEWLAGGKHGPNSPDCAGGDGTFAGRPRPE